MELDKTQLLILGAIGIGAFFLLRKKGGATASVVNTKPATVAAAPAMAGSLWDSFGLSGGLAQALGAAASTATPIVPGAPAPTSYATKPLQVPAEAPRAVFGGTSPAGGGAATGGYLDAEGVWHYPDGSTAYTGGGTFGHTGNGKTQGQNTMAMLGY